MTRRERLSAGVLAVVLAIGCSGARSTHTLAPLVAPAPARSSAPAPPVARAEHQGSNKPLADAWDCSHEVNLRADNQELGQPPSASSLDVLFAHLSDVGPAPEVAVCKHVAQPSIIEATDCRDGPLATGALASALELSDVRQRDRRLAGLERSQCFAPGVVSALRAEFDPACGDRVAQLALKKNGGGLMAPEIHATLVALALAARLARANPALPRLVGEGSEQNVEHYRVHVVQPWVATQTKRIEVTAAQLDAFGAGSYAQAIAAMAVASAWTRTFLTARSGSIPQSMRRLFEQRSRYYGMLDTELTNVRERAARAHADAAVLVSRHGIRHSAWADEWFKGVGAVNSRLHRAAGEIGIIGAPACPATSAVERLARRIPAYYAGLLITAPDLNQPCVVRGLIDQGLSLTHRRIWRESPASADVAPLLAYGSMAIARRSFDAVHFDQAIRQLMRVRESRSRLSPDENLLLATACAARTGWHLSLSPERPGAIQVQSLLRYAESSAPPANRALALLNAAWLVPLGEPSLSEQAYGLFQAARQLANGTPALPCVQAVSNEFGDVLMFMRRTDEPCVIAEPL